jgi:hypothetical protein
MLVAPISEDARRTVEGIVGRPCTDADVLAWQRDHSIECRDIPEKAAVLQLIAADAIDLCEQLAEAGVEFAGKTCQAAAIVTGTVYAAWRAGLREDVDATEPACRHATSFRAVGHAIEHARCYVDGMPAMFRDDYLLAVAGSEDLVDQMPLREVLAALWPEQFPDGEFVPRSPAPASADDGSEFLNGFLENTPNILDHVTVLDERV